MQLPLFPSEPRPFIFVNERGLVCPFSHHIDRQCLSHSGRFIYWDYTRQQITFSHNQLFLCFYTEDGILKSRPMRMDHPTYGVNPYVSDDDFKDLQPVARRKPRKPYKWSKQAKARNRRRLLKKRIKKQHGYDPERPDFFDGETLLAIEAEYQDRIASNPIYYIDGNYNR